MSGNQGWYNKNNLCQWATGEEGLVAHLAPVDYPELAVANADKAESVAPSNRADCARRARLRSAPPALAKAIARQRRKAWRNGAPLRRARPSPGALSKIIGRPRTAAEALSRTGEPPPKRDFW